MKSKGQVFIVAAVIFSSLILLAVSSLGSFVQGSDETLFQDYFQQSMEQPVDAFNSGLEENSSGEYLKKKIYNSNRFLYVQSRSKSIDYASMQFFILPRSGKAVLINYNDVELNSNISLNGAWHNRTIGPRQSEIYSFSPGKSESKIIVGHYGIDRSFDAVNPRILIWSSMRSSRENWVNSRLH